MKLDLAVVGVVVVVVFTGFFFTPFEFTKYYGICPHCSDTLRFSIVAAILMLHCDTTVLGTALSRANLCWDVGLSAFWPD